MMTQDSSMKLAHWVFVPFVCRHVMHVVRVLPPAGADARHQVAVDYAKQVRIATTLKNAKERSSRMRTKTRTHTTTMMMKQTLTRPATQGKRKQNLL